MLGLNTSPARVEKSSTVMLKVFWYDWNVRVFSARSSIDLWMASSEPTIFAGLLVGSTDAPLCRLPRIAMSSSS